MTDGGYTKEEAAQMHGVAEGTPARQDAELIVVEHYLDDEQIDRGTRLIEAIEKALAARDAELARLKAAMALALPLLERDRQVVVECHSDLETVEGNDEPQPVPGTLEHGAESEAVAEYDAAIEACKGVATPATEAGRGGH